MSGIFPENYTFQKNGLFKNGLSTKLYKCQKLNGTQKKDRMGHSIDNRAMGIIVDELKKNDVNIDITILSGYIQYILNSHEGLYNDIVSKLNSEELQNVFNEMDVINVGRALAYLFTV